MEEKEYGEVSLSIPAVYPLKAFPRSIGFVRRCFQKNDLEQLS